MPRPSPRSAARALLLLAAGLGGAAGYTLQSSSRVASFAGVATCAPPKEEAGPKIPDSDTSMCVSRAEVLRTLGAEKEISAGPQGSIRVPLDGSRPKVLWMYWAQGIDEAPQSVKLCHKRWAERAKKDGYELHLISQANMRDYVGDIETRAKDLTHWQMADMLRLQLLWKFGGVWADITTMPTESLDWLERPDLRGQEVIGFNLAADSFRQQDQFAGKIPPNLENWFIAGAARSEFVCKWWKEFEVIMLMTPKVYNQHVFDKGGFSYQAIHPDLHEYLTAYVVFQKVAQLELRGGRNPKKAFKLSWLEANSGPFIMEKEFDWNEKKVAKAFFGHPQPTLGDPHYLIKFWKGARQEVDQLLELKKPEPTQTSYARRFLLDPPQ